MHTPFDDGIFFGLFPRRPLLCLFCLCFSFKQKKKKKEKNLRAREKMWDLASPKSLSLQTVSRLLFLFCGFIGILDTSPLTLHTCLFDTMNTHITLYLFIYLFIYLSTSIYLCKIITIGMCRSISTF